MKKIISAALLALAVGGAQAQAYIGGAFGLSKLSCGTVSCDDSDSGYKAYLGYVEPNAKLGVEAGYIDFGETTENTPAGTVDKTKALFLAAVARWDFTSNFGGNAKLGFANVETSCRMVVVSPTPSNVSETSITYLAGLGLDYAFTKNVKAVAALDVSQANCGGQSGTVGLLSLGAQYSF